MAYPGPMQRHDRPEQPPTHARIPGPHRPSPVLGMLALAGLLAAGCRNSTPTPAATGRPVVTLLDPGAAPRRALRYRLSPGAEEAMIMRTDMTIETKTDGTPAPPVEYPTVAMTLRLRVVDAQSLDHARYEFALESAAVEDAPGLQPEVVATLRQHFQDVTGMTGSANIDARGFNWNARMEPPRGRDTTPAVRQMIDNAAQGMERMSAPLPEEPVGRGARWELRQTIEQNGVTLQQRTLFELLELDGQRGVLATQITQHADRQPMTITGMPAGTAELLSLDSTGAGRLQFDLDRLAPRSTLTIHSDYAVRVTSEDAPQTIDTRVEMHVEINGS
jgi:hypothetical protein